MSLSECWPSSGLRPRRAEAGDAWRLGSSEQGSKACRRWGLKALSREARLAGTLGVAALA